MTVFRAATLRTFFFAFHAGAKELKIPNYLPKRRCMLSNLAKSLNNNISSVEEEFGEW